MFDSFKKAILAKRIKKAVKPASIIALDGITIYEKVLHTMLQCSSQIIEQAIPIIEDNAHEIAEAILILEPVFKELADMRAIRELKESESFEEYAQDQEVNQCVESIKEAAAEFEAAIKST